MIILNPLEPWPGELCLDAAARHEVKVHHPGGRLRRPLLGRPAPGHGAGRTDHRSFRPAGWIEAGLEKLERLLPFAERADLTPMRLACQWNLAHPAVECVAPTLIQEVGAGGADDRVQASRAGRHPRRPAPLRGRRRRDPRDRRQHRPHGAEGRQARPSRARSSPTAGPSARELAEVGSRWGIDPERDLVDLTGRPAAQGAATRAEGRAVGSLTRSDAEAAARRPHRRSQVVDAGRRLFGLFLLMLDSTVVSLALPEIRGDVGASAEGLQWMMNGYLLTIAVLVVTAGRLGDMFGRKRVFLAGMVALRASARSSPGWRGTRTC